MLVFYCNFLSGWSGSGVMPMALQSVPVYREQLFDYYGVSILLNLKNLAGRALFYYLYGSVPLFDNYKKMSRVTAFFSQFT